MTVNPALVNLFNSIVETNATYFVARLYTVTLFGGDVLRWTDSDCDIIGVEESTPDLYLAGDLYQQQYMDLYAYGASLIAGYTYSAAGPKIDNSSSKTQVHLKVGLDTDTWTLTVAPRPFDPITGATFPDTIGSVPFLQACIGGALDSADFQVDEAYFLNTPPWPIPYGGVTPIGCKIVFAGTVAEVDVTNAVAIITVNDYRSLLTLSMPRHFFQAQCRHTLFDSGCNASGNMNASSFATTGAATSASTPSAVVISGGISPPSGSGTYALGRIVGLTGLNATFQRTIKSWDGATTLTLFNPLPFTVSAGDTFTYYPGCSKVFTTCQLFQPTTAYDNYGGQLFIPPPEILGGQ
jgi:uncharacterized protein